MVRVLEEDMTDAGTMEVVELENMLDETLGCESTSRVPVCSNGAEWMMQCPTCSQEKGYCSDCRNHVDAIVREHLSFPIGTPKIAHTCGAFFALTFDEWISLWRKI